SEKDSAAVARAREANARAESAAGYGYNPPAVTNRGDVVYVETLPLPDGTAYSHTIWLAERARGYARRQIAVLPPDAIKVGYGVQLEASPDGRTLASLEPIEKSLRLMLRDLTSSSPEARPVTGLEAWGPVSCFGSGPCFAWASENKLIT